MRPQEVRSTNLAWTYGIERPMFASPEKKLIFIFAKDEETLIGDLA